MNPTILRDVSLCAIVRDEMVNSAGGIEDFVSCTVPYVERAVIVDTGSRDGTREKLFELKKQYKKLSVFKRQFTDFADMRNYSLQKVKTPFALILDADERLFPGDYAELKKHLDELTQEKQMAGLELPLWYIYPEVERDYHGGGHNPRLFRVEPDFQFRNVGTNRGEFLYRITQTGKTQVTDYLSTNIEIKHFCSGRGGTAFKRDNWYNNTVHSGEAKKVSPSMTEGFKFWKELNPRRESFTQS